MFPSNSHFFISPPTYNPDGTRKSFNVGIIFDMPSIAFVVYGGTRQFVMNGLLYYSACASVSLFSSPFSGFIARPFEGAGVGFEEPYLRLVAQLVEPGSPQISHSSVYAARRVGLMIWVGFARPAITLRTGNWSVSVCAKVAFGFLIVTARAGRETHIVRCHRGSGGTVKLFVCYVH